MSKKYHNYKQYSKPEEVVEPQEENVEEIDEQTPAEPKTKTAVVANCHSVNVRAKADPNSDVVTVLPKDEPILIFNEVGNYYNVKTSDRENKTGLTGFIQKDYIDIL